MRDHIYENDRLVALLCILVIPIRLYGLPRVRLSPIQLVLNAVVRLIAHFPQVSHIST